MKKKAKSLLAIVENLPDHNPNDVGKFEVTTLAGDFPESLSIPLADFYERQLWRSP